MNKNKLVNYFNYSDKLNEWLEFFFKNHPKEIDLGLERIKIVAERLQLLNFSIPVITISGTNGKGSCAATLESIYKTAGYNVGVFSSPFLLNFNEQIRVNQQEVTDDTLCDGFAMIYPACRELSLSAFEFTTLAALIIFKQKKLDIIILEVGMGGKRDAVNIIDPNLAIVTNVALEHQQWLGESREQIGAEKAGILRKNISAVIGEANLTKSISDTAKNLGVTLYCQDIDFFYKENDGNFFWEYKDKGISDIPLPQLAPTNIANALMAIELLQKRLPVKITDIKIGINNAKLPGRFEIRHEPVMQIFDVAHNPAGVKFLKANVKKFLHNKKVKKIRAVFSMFADKDIINSISPFIQIIDEWYIAPLKDKRAASMLQLTTSFSELHCDKIYKFESIKAAYFSAMQNSCENDLMIVFGSFRTVAEVI